MNEAHPDTMIGRAACTCGYTGLEAHFHITPCEIKLRHLETLPRRTITDHAEAHGADE